MNFSWTPHRFSGGALALDVANTVILRFDPDRRIDRFEIDRQFAEFPLAASTFGADRQAHAPLAPVTPDDGVSLRTLRDSIDGYFRALAQGRNDNILLATLLEAVSAVLRRHAGEAGPCPLDLATARSALRLLQEAETARLKICPGCGWLFIDRSRNRSRSWCDMAVCGNRAKARLHYRRTRKDRRA